MISLFCHPGWRGPIPAQVARERVRVTTDWDSFETCAANAACLVVVQRWLADGGTVERLISLRHHLPMHPLVLATSKDAENARGFRALLAEEVVWLHEIDQTLWPAVRHARSRGYRYALAQRIETNERLAPPLREALALALSAEQPFHSLDALASAVGRCRGTMWYHWRHATGGGEGSPRPEDFLDWVLLIHALSHRTHDRGWSGIAAELGVHEHTLARLAKRLLGLTMRELASTTPELLVERFTRDVLVKLGVGQGPREMH